VSPLLFHALCLQACCVYFALSCLSFLIAVAVYAGTMNKHKKSIPGSFGPGFGLACFSE
jgi:hypothetical protein